MGFTGWSEVREHLASSFHIVEPAGPTPVVVVELAADGAERIAISCSERMVLGCPWIRISIELAPARDMSLASAEYLNFEFTVGALAIEKDVLSLRHDLPLRGLAAASLTDAIQSIGQQASFVRSSLRKPSAEANPFTELYT